MVTKKAVPMDRGVGGEVEVEVDLYRILVEQRDRRKHCQVPSLKKRNKNESNGLRFLCSSHPPSRSQGDFGISMEEGSR